MTLENLSRQLSGIASEYRSLGFKDKLIMGGIGLGTLLIGFVIPAAGVVNASINGQIKRDQAFRYCQPAISINRQQRPINSILEEVAEMGMPIEIYLTNGNYRSQLSQRVNELYKIYNSDIQIKDIDSNRSLTEGSVVTDRSERCRVVLYYP